MSLQDAQKLCECPDGHEDVIKYLNDIVEESYLYRNKYFENHSIDDAINKDQNVEALVKTNLSIFEKHEQQALKTNKAFYNYLKGKLINLKSTYTEEAENFLSTSIKLDPKIVDAWNELGECYCKNREYEKAQSCFEGALKEKRNKVSLRNLSILLRVENHKNRDEKQKNIELGLNYAKEAVQLDPQDGLSWSILGNAHLSYFFGIQQHPSILKQALSAYTQAEKDIVARSTPDLHYNKGVTFRYQEEFKLALDLFNQSSLYDPMWDMPKLKEQRLVKYLQEINHLVSVKGKLKPKKLQTIKQSIDSKQLGPYSGGLYKSPSGSTAKLSETSYSQLKSGVNTEKVILGKVICSIRNEDTVPFTFCSMDREGSIIVTSVFNLADGKGVIIGDSIAIPEPYVTDVDFSYKENSFKFCLVRVETPVIMVVNSKKLGLNFVAGVQMSISSKFD